MPSAALYLRAWLGATIAFIGAVVAINVIVDPYGLFHLVDVAELNRIKSQASERGSLFKHAGLFRMRPAGLILGNSRAEIGFDPESPAWPEWARPVFNLALPGAGLEAVAGEFVRALQRANPKLAVIGLDFLDFRVDPSEDKRFETPAAGRDALTEVREYASALLTMSALLDSLATVKAQGDPYPTSLTPAGFNPKLDYVGIALREGYHALFRQRDQENALAYARGPKSVYQPGRRPAPAFDALDSIIAAARSRGVALRLVIYPYHAHTLILFQLTGLWPAYEDWKWELARRVDAARGTMDVELWDFTGFSPYADERVPRRDDTAAVMQWYWEAGHFKKQLGDLVLAEMLRGHAAGEPWGRRLDGSNVDAELQRQRIARDEYERTHPDETAELVELAAAAARR